MSGNGIGVLLLLMLIGGLVGGEILARLLPRWGHPRAKRTVRILMVVGAAAYGAALVTASLTSRERVLARGKHSSSAASISTATSASPSSMSIRCRALATCEPAEPSTSLRCG